MHQFIGSLPYHLQGFIHLRCLGMGSLPSTGVTFIRIHWRMGMVWLRLWERGPHYWESVEKPLSAVLWSGCLLDGKYKTSRDPCPKPLDGRDIQLQFERKWKRIPFWRRVDCPIQTQLNQINHLPGINSEENVAWSLIERMTFVYMCHKHIGQCW